MLCSSHALPGRKGKAGVDPCRESILVADESQLKLTAWLEVSKEEAPKDRFVLS